MASPALAEESAVAASSDAHLLNQIHHAVHALPAQGPISVFVHHNTLHALQHLSFFDALRCSQETYHCETLLSESAYQEKLKTGRIRSTDLERILTDDLAERGSESIAGLTTRQELRLSMVQLPLQTGTASELEWLIAETDALRRFLPQVSESVTTRMVDATRHWFQRERLQTDSQILDQAPPVPLAPFLEELSFHAPESALENWGESRWIEVCLNSIWRISLAAVTAHGFPHRAPPQFVRPTERLRAATGQNADQVVQEELIRFTSAFLDQGFSQWKLPHRDQGFLNSFLNYYGQTSLGVDPRLRGFSRVAASEAALCRSPLEIIHDCLQRMGIAVEETEPFLERTLLALPGWSGMVWQTEMQTDRVVRPSPRGTFLEFLAARLMLDCHVLKRMAQDAGVWTGTLADLPQLGDRHGAGADQDGVMQRAFTVFQLAQYLGWKPETLFGLSASDWHCLLQEIAEFDNFERRRIMHLAFEHRYRIKALDAVSIHSAAPHPPQKPVRTQVICCIDDREESFRRHLEEIAPDLETFGAPGFFSVAMFYQGAVEAHATPLCPVSVRPRHWVQEDVPFSLENSARLRRRARKVFGQASHGLHLGSRTFAVGAVLSTMLGPLASIPMISRILFPRHTALMREAAGQIVGVPSMTQLRLERTAEEPGPEEDQIGFTVAEMANIVERLLRDIGLTKEFAPLILVLGHGSSSQNNPHASAYNCGACSGSRGGPNARAVSQMANDPRVRFELARRGISIPDRTCFVGGYHNTCNDEVEFFNLDRLPTSHRKRFLQLQETILTARQRNALERCRRFDSAALSMTPEEALKHVEGRSEDLAQVRPEYNHATNALCIVGRRERTRGLFLDRRSFLQSYDPMQDDERSSILTRILQAAVPVCAGINLEYYFSTVDPIGWGCGNKLPHNVVSLLGVMEGAQSDLRTGLSQQMVEIHEPMRILFVIETTPQAMIGIMEENPSIREHVINGWIQLALLDPGSSNILTFVNGEFVPYSPESTELPVAASSYDWFRGWRQHLGFASIRSSDESPTLEQRPAQGSTT